MGVFKKWLIRVNFDDGSYSEGISKKDFRENGIIHIIKLNEKKFPLKRIISVESSQLF